MFLINEINLTKILLAVSILCTGSLVHADIVHIKETKFWFKDSIYDSNNNPEEFCASNKMTYTEISPTFTDRDITSRDEKSLTWLIKKRDSLNTSDLTNRCFMVKLENQQVVRGVSLSNHSQRLIKGYVLSVADRNPYLELKLELRN